MCAPAGASIPEDDNAGIHVVCAVSALSSGFFTSVLCALFHQWYFLNNSVKKDKGDKGKGEGDDSESDKYKNKPVLVQNMMNRPFVVNEMLPESVGVLARTTSKAMNSVGKNVVEKPVRALGRNIGNLVSAPFRAR